MKTMIQLFCFAALTSLAGAKTFVTYEEFGAVGDGKTDDQQAIVRAHAAANRQGLPVRATDGKTYYIGAGTKTATVKTDVDFGTAKFIIDDSHVTADNRHAAIFDIAPSTKPYPIKGVKTLARGQRRLPITLAAPALLHAVDKTTMRYIREGLNQNNGSSQQEVFLVAADGTIDPKTPLIWDFKQISSLTATPLDARPLIVRGGTFVTIANQAESKYNYYARNFRIRRSNVRIEGLRHEVTGELDHGAPYGGFLSISHCANVLVTNCILTAHRTYRTIGAAGKPVSMGSYDLGANNAVNVSFVHCRQTTDITDARYWGLFGSNYCKNLVYDDCVFSRFDAHMGVANATVRNSRLGYMGLNAIGFGTLTIENTTILGYNFINLRSDYGSTWEGDVVIRNCTFIPANGRKTTGHLIGGYFNGFHDFGYVCHMPRRILIDGLKVDDRNVPEGYNGPFLFNNITQQNTSAAFKPKHPYIVTEEVVLKNVTTASGKPFRVSPNTYMFRNTKVTTRPCAAP